VKFSRRPFNLPFTFLSSEAAPSPIFFLRSLRFLPWTLCSKDVGFTSKSNITRASKGRVERSADEVLLISKVPKLIIRSPWTRAPKAKELNFRNDRQGGFLFGFYGIPPGRSCHRSKDYHIVDWIKSAIFVFLYELFDVIFASFAPLGISSTIFSNNFPSSIMRK